MNWYLKVLKQYADFSGRARRKEYWMFVLFNIIIIVILGAILGFIGYTSDSPMMLFLVYIYVFAVLIPSIAVSVRRMHDTGKSGWWYLINFIPYVGGIIFMILAAMDSEPGENKWGKNPKGIGNTTEIDQIGTE